MAITNLSPKLTSVGNQGSATDYSSTSETSVFQFDYQDLDYTPKTTDAYKNDFEEELQVFINGIRIYRTATDTGIDDVTLGLSTNQKSRLTTLTTSTFPWDIETSTKKVQINKTHASYGDSDSNSPGYPALNTWTIIKVIRIKPDKTTLSTDFQSASVLTEAELDNAFSETFHMAQESVDVSTDALSLGPDNVWDANSTRIKNLGQPTANNDAVRKVDVDSGIGTEITTVAGLETSGSKITTVAGKATEIDVLVNKYDGSTTATSGTNRNITQVDTVADAVANVNLVAASIGDVNTVEDNITNVNAVAGAIAGSQTYTVTVTNPGGGNIFVLDGNNNPAITLTKGFTYTFDQSDPSNVGHTLQIRDASDNVYNPGGSAQVVTAGSGGGPGSAGAKTVFVVPANAPTTGLRYYCVAHGEGMGNTITTANNDLGAVAAIGASNLNTVATNAESTSIVMGIALG